MVHHFVVLCNIPVHYNAISGNIMQLVKVLHCIKYIVFLNTNLPVPPNSVGGVEVLHCIPFPYTEAPSPSEDVLVSVELHPMPEGGG